MFRADCIFGAKSLPFGPESVGQNGCKPDRELMGGVSLVLCILPCEWSQMKLEPAVLYKKRVYRPRLNNARQSSVQMYRQQQVDDVKNQSYFKLWEFNC